MRQYRSLEQAQERADRLNMMCAEVLPGFHARPTTNRYYGNLTVAWKSRHAVSPEPRKAVALIKLKEGTGHQRVKCIKHGDIKCRLDHECDGVFPYDAARNPYITCGRP